MSFISGFKKVADDVRANIASGFNNASGSKGLSQNWSRLKSAFSGAPAPAPRNVSPATPPKAPGAT